MKTDRQENIMTSTNSAAATKGGPDEEKVKAILDRTGYTLDVTTGQRKYGGPPPNWEGSPPGHGCEVFVGKIPKEMFEDELIPQFEKAGRIWDLRLMMDPLTNQNRGYAFVTYCTPESAQQAVKQLDNHEIKKGKTLKVNISIPNLRLFVGNIPKSKGKEEIFEEFGKLAAGLTEVIIYSSPDDKKKNRGFCFLEYESHKSASLAKRRLGSGRIKVWGCDIIVDWADPQEEPDHDTMSKVKVLYVRNLTGEVTEEKLKEAFEAHGKVERVKKIKDYAFVHFEDRDNAVSAMNDLNGKDMSGAVIEVSLAKPPSDKKKKEELLRNRERRMMSIMAQRQDVMPPRGRGMRGPPGRGDYEFGDYDYYGYGDYRGGYADPYYEDYYGYDDYYDYPYGPPAPPPPPRGGRGGRPGPDRGRGRGGQAMRARGVGLAPRARGVMAPRGRGGVGRGRANLVGKRKFDGSQNQVVDSKRRYPNSNWGNAPIPQQPLDISGYGGGEWYQDNYGPQWG